MLIGDSFTEGIGVRYEDTFAGLAAAALAPRGIEVLNAGVASFSPIIYLRRVQDLVEDVGLRFDHLVVFIDIGDIQDEVTYAFDAQGNVVSKEGRRLREERANRVQGRPFFLRSLALRRFLDRHTILLARLYAAADALLTRGPRRAALWTVDAQAFEEYGPEGLEKARAHMDALRELLARHGIGLTVAVYPWPDQVLLGDRDSKQARYWRAWAAEKRAGFIDYFPVFVGVGDAKETVRRDFIPGDIHWNEAGHRLVAEPLIAHLARVAPPRPRDEALAVKARPAAEAALVLALLAALAGQLAWGIASDGMTNDEVLYISAGYRQLALGDYRLNPTQAAARVRRSPRSGSSGSGPACLRSCPARGSWTGAGSSRTSRTTRARCSRGHGFRPRSSPSCSASSCGRGRGPWPGRWRAWPRSSWPRSSPRSWPTATSPRPTSPAPSSPSSPRGPSGAGCARPGGAKRSVVGLALGLAAAARITTWVAAAVLLAVLLVALGRRDRAPGLDRASLRLLLVVAVVVPALLWATYGFHDAPWPDELMRRPRVEGAAGRVLDALDAAHVVPAGYVGSLRFQVDHNRGGHPGYLLGERRKTGWWYYPPVAFLVKNTPGFLLALLAAAAVALGRPRSGAAGVPTGLWLALALVVIATASLSRIQIGERYLLPAYPFLILLAACATPALLARRGGWLVALAIGLLHAAPTLARGARGHAVVLQRPRGRPPGRSPRAARLEPRLGTGPPAARGLDAAGGRRERPAGLSGLGRPLALRHRARGPAGGTPLRLAAAGSTVRGGRGGEPEPALRARSPPGGVLRGPARPTARRPRRRLLRLPDGRATGALSPTGGGRRRAGPQSLVDTSVAG